MLKNKVYKVIFNIGIGNILGKNFGNRGGVILAYHRVSPMPKMNCLLSGMYVDPLSFEKQIAYLNKNYRVVSLDKFMEYPRMNYKTIENTAVITFDDAYADNYKYAFPILRKYGIPATIFVPTAFIESGRLFWWDRLADMLANNQKKYLVFRYEDKKYNFLLEKSIDRKKTHGYLLSLLKRYDINERETFLDLLSSNLEVKNRQTDSSALSWGQIKEMSQNNISFGSHTHNHLPVSSLTDDNIREELNKPREILQYYLKQRIDYFAYPYGEANDFNAESPNLLSQAGYLAGLTMIQRKVTLNSNPFILPRIGIGGEDTGEIFKLKLLGVIPFIRPKIAFNR